MLSVAAFDILYTHVRAFDESAPAGRVAVPWTIAGSPISMTTRGRTSKRRLTAFFRTAGGVDVVACFRVQRGWFRTWVVADVAVGGQQYARRIRNALELRHTFDRVALARVVAEMEKQADQLHQLPIGVPDRRHTMAMGL